MSELKLEVGKYYRTRCGTKAKLMEFFEGQWFGAILSLGDRWLARQWHASGQYDPVFKTCGMDIVAEWNDDDDWEDVDPSKITLDMLPVKCRFKGDLKSVGGGGAGQAYKFCWDGDWTDGHLYQCLRVLGGYRYQCGNGVWWRQCQIRKGEK